jgi:general secretion pathway protein G
MIVRLQRYAKRLVRRRGRQAGYTLTELVVVCVILGTLSTVLYPTAKFTVQRYKEEQLRLALRELRNAIDEYKRYSDAQLLPIELGTDGYPSELEQLLEAQQLVGQGPDVVKRFLRRIPVDPMTGETEWGLRSYQDDWDTESWGGENVFDVFSLSDGVGLDGVPYRFW